MRRATHRKIAFGSFPSAFPRPPSFNLIQFCRRGVSAGLHAAYARRELISSGAQDPKFRLRSKNQISHRSTFIFPPWGMMVHLDPAEHRLVENPVGASHSNPVSNQAVGHFVGQDALVDPRRDTLLSVVLLGRSTARVPVTGTQPEMTDLLGTIVLDMQSVGAVASRPASRAGACRSGFQSRTAERLQLVGISWSTSATKACMS